MSISSAELGFLCDFIVESERIEGMQTNPKEVRMRLYDMANDLAPPAGHEGALLLLRSVADLKEPMSGVLIRHVQELIVSDQSLRGGDRLDLRKIGRWREESVWAGDQEGCDALHVPGAMRDFIEETEKLCCAATSMQPQEIVPLIATLHYFFEKVHPFCDGNGRSGRALAYFTFRATGLEPFVFPFDDRPAYCAACEVDNDSTQMIVFFFRHAFAPSE